MESVSFSLLVMPCLWNVLFVKTVLYLKHCCISSIVVSQTILCTVERPLQLLMTFVPKGLDYKFPEGTLRLWVHSVCIVFFLCCATGKLKQVLIMHGAWHYGFFNTTQTCLPLFTCKNHANQMLAGCLNFCFCMFLFPLYTPDSAKQLTLRIWRGNAALGTLEFCLASEGWRRGCPAWEDASPMFSHLPKWNLPSSGRSQSSRCFEYLHYIAPIIREKKCMIYIDLQRHAIISAFEIFWISLELTSPEASSALAMEPMGFLFLASCTRILTSPFLKEKVWT